ncbi:MAG: PspC domain-containing protein [Deltaproteobacteria bacterium]|nr:PspC domain-containing protein [Deltaproteobacteria bacterium]
MAQLRRSDRNRKLLGVCGGLGEHLGIDPTFMRIIFVAAALLGGPGIICYLLASVVMPAPNALPSGPSWQLPGR